jgi:hypothetical protein
MLRPQWVEACCGRRVGRPRAIRRNGRPDYGVLEPACAAAAGVAAAVVYTLVATPFWTPFFLVPGLACAAFAVYGFLLASRMPEAVA